MKHNKDRITNLNKLQSKSSQNSILLRHVRPFVLRTKQSAAAAVDWHDHQRLSLEFLVS